MTDEINLSDALADLIKEGAAKNPPESAQGTASPPSVELPAVSAPDVPELKAVPSAINPASLVQSVKYGESREDRMRALRFTLKRGEVLRLAILDEYLSQSQVHYFGRYVYCLGEDCPYCNESDPAVRYQTWVYAYNCDRNGTPLSPVSGNVYSWIFGRDKYPVLARVASSQDIRTIDFSITCDEERFQRFTIVPLPESPLWMAEDVAPKVMEELEAVKKEFAPTDLIASLVSADRAPVIIQNWRRREAERNRTEGRDSDEVSGPVASANPVDREQLMSLLASLQGGE